MKVKLSLFFVVVTIVASATYAQTGVAGKWIGELSATDGHGVAQPISIELKLEGDTLSGTVTEGALEARPIQGGTVDGMTVSFRTVRNFGGSDINVNWKGELKGEDLALTREIGPAPADAGGGGGRGGGRGGAAGAAGGGRGARGGAAAGGAQRGAAAGAEVPPVPNADQAGAAADAGAARGGRGGAAAGGRGGGARGAGAPPAAGGAAAAQGAGGARGGTPAAGPTVALTLHRAR